MTSLNRSKSFSEGKLFEAFPSYVTAQVYLMVERRVQINMEDVADFIASSIPGILTIG
jgi:hypothetical protein